MLTPVEALVRVRALTVEAETYITTAAVDSIFVHTVKVLRQIVNEVDAALPDIYKQR